MADRSPSGRRRQLQPSVVRTGAEYLHSKAAELVEEAAQNGAKIIVLPELRMSGAPIQAWRRGAHGQCAGEATDAFSEVTKKYGCYTSRLGWLSSTRDRGDVITSAALVGPEGYVGKYRKNGINMGDVTTFRPGNTGYPVFPTEYGNITMLICYD